MDTLWYLFIDYLFIYHLFYPYAPLNYGLEAIFWLFSSCTTSD